MISLLVSHRGCIALPQNDFDDTAKSAYRSTAPMLGTAASSMPSNGSIQRGSSLRSIAKSLVIVGNRACKCSAFGSGNSMTPKSIPDRRRQRIDRVSGCDIGNVAQVEGHLKSWIWITSVGLRL